MTHVTRNSDIGRTLRVRVTARNTIGTETATSVPTAVINVAAPTGCPGGNGPINITQVTPPARLLVDSFQANPNPIPRNVGALTVGFRVSACGGRPVAGALVYVTAVPYNQFAIQPEAQTGGDGIAILRMPRLKGFPAAREPDPARDVRPRPQGRRACARGHLDAAPDLLPAREVTQSNEAEPPGLSPRRLGPLCRSV